MLSVPAVSLRREENNLDTDTEITHVRQAAFHSSLFIQCRLNYEWTDERQDERMKERMND